MNEKEPTVWVPGTAPTDHRAASGKGPEVAYEPLGEEWRPMPLPVLSGLNTIDVGVRERVHKGRHEAQSFAAVYDGSLLESPVYGLVIAADEAPMPDPMDSTRPVAIRELTIQAARERAWSAATARAHMKSDERSPRDMIAIARDLAAQAQRLYTAWRSEQDAIEAQRQLDAEDMELAMRVKRGFALLEEREGKHGKSKE